jgi:hypothetical protein
LATKSTSDASPTKELSNDPIKFFGSQASKWQAKHSRTGQPDGQLWYQPLVVVTSVAVFLIYFCILREENDIDRDLEISLYDRVDGLEATDLTLSYRYNKKRGLDVTALEKRMRELGVDIEAININ